MVSYKALAIIVLGGLGSVRGTLVASLVLGLVESYGTIFIGAWLDRDAIAFLALIALLMIRPQGFTGARDGMSAYEISLISIIGINVMLAVSLNMISGFCGQISLGHGAFYGAGAYAAALAWSPPATCRWRSRRGIVAAACSASSSASPRCACAAIFWR